MLQIAKRRNTLHKSIKYYTNLFDISLLFRYAAVFSKLINCNTNYEKLKEYQKYRNFRRGLLVFSFQYPFYLW